MTESLWFTDALVRVHISPEATGGRFAVLEALAPPGHMPPPHVHERDDEAFFVLEGEVTVHTTDGATAYRPGDAGYVAAGVAHAIEITSKGPARALIFAAPPGFVGFVRDCSIPADRPALPPVGHFPPAEQVLAAAANHHVRVLGPAGTTPADEDGRARTTQTDAAQRGQES